MSESAAITIAMRMVDKASGPMARAFGIIEKRSARLDKVMRGLSMTVKGVMGIFAMAMGGLGVSQLIKTADTYTLVGSRLQLVTKNSEELATAETELYAIANKTRTSYTSTVNLFTKMSRATKDLDISQQDMLSTTEIVNKTLLISGASAQEANAALIQFSQGLSSGAIMGEELRSVLEQTPRLAQAIADGMGVPVARLRELGSEGKLTSEVVVKGLLSQADAIENEFGRIPTTVGQAWIVLKNRTGRLVDQFNKAMGMTKGFAGSILDLAGLLERFGNYLATTDFFINFKAGLLTVKTLLVDGWQKWVGSFIDNTEQSSKALEVFKDVGIIVAKGIGYAFNILNLLFEGLKAGIKILVSAAAKYIATLLEIYIPALEALANTSLAKKMAPELVSMVQDLEGFKNQANTIAGDLFIDVGTNSAENVKQAFDDLIDGSVNNHAIDTFTEIKANLQEISAQADETQDKLANLGKPAFDFSAPDTNKDQKKNNDDLNRIWLASLVEEERAIAQVNQQFDAYRETMDGLEENGTIGLDRMIELWEQLDLREEEALNSLGQNTDKMSEFAVQSARSMQSAFSSFFMDMDQGWEGMAKSFGETVKQMAADALAAQLLETLMGANYKGGAGSGLVGTAVNFVAGFFGSGGANANGNVFNNGSVMAFANGGIFDSPTYFPMAGGKTGLMGEAGPEAVMPLKRGRDGKLGVAAGNNQAPAVQVAPPVVNNIIVDDPKKISRYLATSDGSKSVLNIIQQNAGQIKGVLR